MLQNIKKRKPIQNKKSRRKLKLSKSQPNQQIFNYFNCKLCFNAWENGYNSTGFCDKKCKRSNVNTSLCSKNEHKSRFIGYYTCSTCEKQWTAKFSSNNPLKSCANCDEKNLKPSTKKIHQKNSNKTKISKYCQKCKRLEYSCSKLPASTVGTYNQLNFLFYENISHEYIQEQNNKEKDNDDDNNSINSYDDICYSDYEYNFAYDNNNFSDEYKEEYDNKENNKDNHDGNKNDNKNANKKVNKNDDISSYTDSYYKDSHDYGFRTISSDE